MIYYNKCFEVSPSFLKGQIKTFNPFERIFKNFLFDEIINPFPDEVQYSKENYDKMVENYYIYKNQFKKYGLTFNVNEEGGANGEEISYLSKIFLFPENYGEKYNIKDNKIFYEGKDYYFINTFFTEETYKEKDKKVYFELDFFEYSKKFELQIITLEKQYQKNIEPGESDLLYIDAKKIGKRFESLYKDLTKREIINYRRIMEIPYLFDFTKFASKDPEPQPDLENFDTFSDYWCKLLENAPLYSTDKYDFITMLNIMYEDQYLSNFKQKNKYSEEDDYKLTKEEYLKKYGSKGDLDVKDVENFENFQREKELKQEVSIGDFFPKRNSYKQNLMEEEYPFIEGKKVIYEICDREKDSYRRYLIYDPVNNFCSFYTFEDNFDNYIYGLKK